MIRKAPRRTAQRILETALEMFNRFGEPHVSTTAISAELGISPGNLYYHYPAKDELVNALFERHQQALAPLLAAAATSHSIGPKKVLIVPVDFSDLTGQPTSRDKKTTYTTAYCQTFADNELAPFYSQSSYGQTSLTNTVAPLLRLPRTAAYYATAQNSGGVFTGDSDIRTDTLAAATAAGRRSPASR